MKLASLKDGGRDGRLVVVDRTLQRCAPVMIPCLQAALDDWDKCLSALADTARKSVV